jgi:hypothetical protein
VATVCPYTYQTGDVFALGTDHAVWDYNGRWHSLGFKSTVAPAVAQLTTGETDLFARGTDNALWMNVRAPGAAAWQGWHRVGGYLTSAPAAASSSGDYGPPPEFRTVLALGGDGALWQGRNRVGTSTWAWTQVP